MAFYQENSSVQQLQCKRCGCVNSWQTQSLHTTLPKQPSSHSSSALLCSWQDSFQKGTIQDFPFSATVLFKSKLTCNTSLFSSPRYFPSRLDRIHSFWAALSTKFPLSLIQPRDLWCGSLPGPDHLARVARHGGVNLTCRIRSRAPSPKALLGHQY